MNRSLKKIEELSDQFTECIAENTPESRERARLLLCQQSLVIRQFLLANAPRVEDKWLTQAGEMVEKTFKIYQANAPDLD